MRKKTEKLQQCTHQVVQEIKELDRRRKKEKRAAQEVTEGGKGEFLRAAAIVQRRLDDNSEELQRLRSAIERDQPELQEMRDRLSVLEREQRARRAQVEREQRERMVSINEELDALRALGDDETRFGNG